MSKFEKIISGLVGLAIVLSLIAIFNSPAGKLGGTVENYPTWFTNGIYAGMGKQVSVDNRGNIITTGTITAATTTTTGTAMTLSGNLTAVQGIFSGAVSGTTGHFTGIATLATSTVTKFCVYNGSNYTQISFASNSVTPSYATSTTCL